MKKYSVDSLEVASKARGLSDFVNSTINSTV